MKFVETWEAVLTFCDFFVATRNIGFIGSQPEEGLEDEYELACEHQHSCIALLAYLTGSGNIMEYLGYGS